MKKQILRIIDKSANFLIKRSLMSSINQTLVDRSNATSTPKPKLKKPSATRNAIVFSVPDRWECLINENVQPEFEVITYSYDGRDAEPKEIELLGWKQHLKFETEFFGASIKQIISLLPNVYDRVLIINSDVAVSYSDINRLFFFAQLYDLDICQPSMSPNGYNSHGHLLNNPLLDVEYVKHIEAMIFCLSRKVISKLKEVEEIPISGWGLDNVILERIRQSLGLPPSAVVHAVRAIHCKPIESNQHRFSNGLTANEELDRLLSDYPQSLHQIE